MEGVTFVVPVHNGEASVRETLAAIFAQADGCSMEVIVVDDDSDDGSLELLHRIGAHRPLRILSADGRGAAAAINVGIRAARFPIICQLDQDVVIGRGWMQRVTAEFRDPTVAAVQGYYLTNPESSLFARAMSLDLEQRYSAIAAGDTDHVCTGNSAYRADALSGVGLFDEALGYGYDNDMSYRLRAAGWRLTIRRDAQSFHRWREGLGGYMAQQYGFGYGRLDVLAKHPSRMLGDSVSPAPMMLHPVMMAIALALAPGGLLVARLAPAGGGFHLMVRVSGAILLALSLERLVVGLRAARRFRSPTPLIFPLLHLGRDCAWVAAMISWSARRLAGWPTRPSHSMRRRPRPAYLKVPAPNRPAT
jgi:hypothetical protein